MHVRSILGVVSDVAPDLGHHDEVELKSIEGDDVRSERLATEPLEKSGGEALRVREGWHIEYIRQTSMAPLCKEMHSFIEVLDPATEWLQREVSFVPTIWHLVNAHTSEDVFKVRGDDR